MSTASAEHFYYICFLLFNFNPENGFVLPISSSEKSIDKIISPKLDFRYLATDLRNGKTLVEYPLSKVESVLNGHSL